MAKINFPGSPSTDDTYTFNSITWQWDGEKWVKSAATETGNAEGNTGEVAYYPGKGSDIRGATAFFYGGAGVGIGTSGPTQMLDVRGGITASGRLYAAQGITSGGHIHLDGDIIMTNQGFIKVENDTESIYLNAGGGQFIFSATNCDFKQKLRHDGDTDTYLDFTTNNIGMHAGGVQFLEGTTTKTNLGGITAGHSGLTAGVLQVDGEMVISGNIIVTEDAVISIGGDTEKITFNGASARIDISAGTVMVDQYIGHAGDSNTWQRFQSDQWTLRCGGTDVIDANATSVNFADTEVQRPKLKDYSETALATSSKSASFNVDFESGNVQSFTFADDLTVSFTNPPASGTAGTVTLIITNGGANTTTWNAAVKWPGDNAPALTSSGVDVVSFMTIDAGTIIYGFVGGINFS